MTRYVPNYTAEYYDGFGSRESTRWEAGNRKKMQRAVFRHHLRMKVKTNDRVLDAGSGPGTFANDLLEIGARVSCFDISKVQLYACREMAPGCEAYEQGSVTDLSQFADGSFDVTLALGGILSYCFEQAPVALKELIRVTKRGGWIGMSVMNLYGTIHSLLPGILTISLEKNKKIVGTGNLSRSDTNGHECHMFRVNEFQELLISTGLEDIELHASGWLVSNDQAVIPEIDSEEWNFLFQAELEASRESPGAGTHIIAWARTP